MRVTDTHIYFWGSHFSNFWLCPIYATPDCAVTGFRYNCAEQLYMVEKAMFFNDHDSALMMCYCPDGKSVKALGRKVKNFDQDEWNKVSYDKMLIACRGKYTQNKNLVEELINTKNKVMVESSPSDKIWGVGLHESDDRILNESNWTGENRLGKVLMQIRSELI